MSEHVYSLNNWCYFYIVYSLFQEIMHLFNITVIWNICTTETSQFYDQHSYFQSGSCFTCNLISTIYSVLIFFPYI